MRLSTLVAGVFGALVAAAPIEDNKASDLTTGAEGCGTITLDTGFGYGLVNDRKCYSHRERITSFQIRAGYTCTFFTASESCDQNKGYYGWNGPTGRIQNTGRTLHSHQCWNTPQDAAVSEPATEAIAVRTPTEITATDKDPLFNETSVNAKGCGVAMLDDGTGVGYSMISGTCFNFKSLSITNYWINQGCTCFFYTQPCDMSKLYTGFQGRTTGSLAGRRMRGYFCLDHPLDAAAALAINDSPL